MKKQKYDLIFSLGGACSCAQTLNELGFRKMSSPFDWVYGSKFEDRIDILLSDFENWLNKDDLQFANEVQNAEKIHKKVYHNNRTDIGFNHDFFDHLTFDKSYKMVKEKYDRRISRLLSYLDKSESILMVYIETPNSLTKADSNTLIKKYKHIIKKYPNKNIKLMYFNCDTNIKQIEKLCDDNIIKIVDNYKSKKDGDEDYVPDFDVLISYFKGIKVNQTLWQSFKNVFSSYNKFTKFLIKLVPNQRYRILLREKLRNG